MARLLITVHGSGARSGSSWAVTSNWVVPSLPASASAFAAALTTAKNTLSGLSAFRAGIAANYSVAGLHGLAYAGSAPPAVLVADSSGVGFAGSAAVGPPPLAVVVSERTAAAGSSYRGRSYWPWASVANDGSVSAANQTAIRTSWLAMHTSILSALAGAGLSAIHVVYSPKTGNMTPITYIQTGDRVDTARGRYGDAPESYTSQDLPTSLTVPPEDLGMDPGLSADDINEALRNLVNFGPLTLGPLPELADLAATLVKADPAPPVA